MRRDKLMITSPLPLHIRFAHQFRGQIAPDIIKIKTFSQKGFPMLPVAASLTNHL